MKDIQGSVRFLITSLKAYKLLILLVMLSVTLSGQTQSPPSAIKELREGTLIIRFPTSKPKIDTLTAMVARAQDPKNKERLEKDLQQAIQERDTLMADYIAAFKTEYDFSKVAYFFDYDGRNLNTANYYNLDGERIAVADLSEKPIFYIYFDRTDEDAMDALVIYTRNIQKLPRPFPNDFTLGGINVLFLKISGRKYPSWRVEKINTRLYKYWLEVTQDEG